MGASELCADGFAVFCEALPGCHSQGQTREEALENIRGAIEEYLGAATCEVPAFFGTRISHEVIEFPRALANA